MLPLVDMHCHLLAGMDDGPRTPEDALAMCRMAYDEGVRMACATAHQNDRWSAVTPEGIRAGTAQLAQQLREAGIPLTVFPCAEVMVHVELTDAWHAGKVLSIADRKKYLLMEMPHGMFVDLRRLIQMLRGLDLRPILAHPEQQPELLDDPGQIEQLIQLGCLVQVSTKNITDPGDRINGRRLKDWFKRGVVHVLGTDAHSPRRRRPHMAEAYKQVVRWVGNTAADRICSTNGMAILQGLPLRVPEPVTPARRWWARFW
jgi:protein-tyrosine phosphatase